MRVGSLFAGIGGFDLGLERAGFDIRWQVEVNPFCQAVLAKHWPGVRRYGDVRSCTELEAVDLICGGFPCQPHSLAGRRVGGADERNLWPEFIRLIRLLEPRWVVAENVPGLLSSEAGRFFGTVLGDLAQAGYDAEWDCLSAADVGAPHLRERIWIVAYPDSHRTGSLLGPRHGEPKEGLGLPSRGDTPGLRQNVAHARCEPGIRGSEPFTEPCQPHRTGPPNGEEAHRPPRDRREVVNPHGTGRPLAQEGHTGPRIFGARPGANRTPAGTGWWESEPGVGRVVNGLPSRVDRLRGLGNAIVPQIAEWIGREILTYEKLRHGSV